MFSKVLVANRGAIACRILRTLRRMKIASVAVFSEADRHSLHVSQADEAVYIGPAPANQSYLSVDAILNAAKKTGAQAIHPGYGFLSENTVFARACTNAGIAFIGPTPEQVEAFALKHTARAIAQENEIPLLPGTGLLADVGEAIEQAEKLGYPVMLKSSGGGGGIGMRVCRTSAELSEAYEPVLRLSRANFGDSGVYLEKFVERARHIEVQIFGNGKGEVIALGERDCSAQRRHQKVLEETPAFGLAASSRSQLFAAAVKLCKAVQYANAGTVEFIYDADTQHFYFLEVNTRLQVEHGVTEEVTGIDLVEWMVLQAAGELPDLGSKKIEPRGSSIEVRVYAEDPGKNFQPSPGRLTHVEWPGDARVETWVEAGSEITPYYDPMIAKIVVHAPDRPQAIAKLQAALDDAELGGLETNLRYLRQLARSEELAAGSITTSFLGSFAYQRRAIEVLDAGTQTTVQQYPGRLGYWHVGVPPSGPMDSLAFRLANRLVGNEESAAALELTTMGVSLRFEAPITIALTGADMRAQLDGHALPQWSAVEVDEGSVLTMDAVNGPGSRGYLAFHGGIDVPEYLGSTATFILGGFGGHAGRPLRVGDILHVAPAMDAAKSASLSAAATPHYEKHWKIGVLFGPHTAPDFFTPADIEMLFATDWRVHYQIDRTGVRLIGPKPQWARSDGGEAGLHPSNIHDNAYAIGTIDFTGDMPILLGPDGPSLGGFVCPATVVEAELWKLGQLKAGDTVRFQRLSLADAARMEQELGETLHTLSAPLPQLPASSNLEDAILRRHSSRQTSLTYRADGDKYLLIEYGENKLDLGLRLRVHWLEQKLRSENLPGIIDITPGIRSLHLHYDNRRLPREALLDALDSFDAAMPELSDITVPSRIVHMPLSWNDPAAQLAQQKYMQAVRPDAPWCPSNIEFIRRMNGLASIDDVYRIAFDASYLVLGLGDVYLGAPVATPLDPRHRLVTTKYNPARTWTPENAVGIGGAYLCVYGMEGPGGYQLIGRTVQVWNTTERALGLTPGSPWFLRFFDQLRFYPVSAEELLEARDALPHGRFAFRTEATEFSLAKYESFLASIRPEAEAFKAKQKQAFDEERDRWRAAGQLIVADDADIAAPEVSDQVIPVGCSAVNSPVTASVFQIAVSIGQQVAAGEKLIVLDAMKTELIVKSPRAGTLRELRCTGGQLVSAGQALVVMEFK